MSRFPTSLLLFMGCALGALLPLGPQAHASDGSHIPHLALSRTYWRLPMQQSGTPADKLPGNFPFQTTTSADGLVSVHSYRQSASFAQSVLSQIAGYVQHPVKDTLGYGLKHVANIYLYNSRQDFLTGTSSADSQEIGAFTQNSTSSIYLPITENGVNVLSYYLPHELTHLVFHQANDSGHVQDAIRFYPLWLDEGLAASDELPNGPGVADYERALTQYPAQDLFTVFVNDYPISDSVDLVCYAEARRLILYLEKTYGMTAFHQFILALHNGDLNMAMLTTFGADLQTVRSGWQASLGRGAPAHDAGFPVATPTTVPYQPQHLSGKTVQTSLAPVDGQSRALVGVLLNEVLVAILGFAAAAGWFIAVRRPPAPAVSPDAPTLILSTPNPAIPWGIIALVSGIAPLAIVVELLLMPALDWATPYRVGSVLAALAAVALLALGMVAWRRGGSPLLHAAGVGVAVLLALVAVAQVRAVGVAQGAAYAQANYLALARQFEVSNGASGAAVARIDATWAGQALSHGDTAAAITHLRAALSEDPHASQAPTWATQLLGAVQTLGTALVAAHQYSAAEATFHDQATSRTCAAACPSIMQEGGSGALLAWARDLLTHKQFADAKAKLQLAASRYPKTSGGKSAARVIAAKGDLLKAAIAAAGAGDAQAASLLALSVAAQGPGSSTAAIASDISVPVTGQVHEGDPHVNPKGDQIFFAGFKTQAGPVDWYDAKTYHGDASLVKVLATVGDDGAFTVALPPGYWYIAFWDDPSRSGNNYFNSVGVAGRGVFYVGAFLPVQLGMLSGS